MESASAQNLTSFTPDIVLECRIAGTEKISSLCRFTCGPQQIPADSSMSTWTAAVWLFERLEFFSKEHRASESWLIAVRGRGQSPAIKDNSIFFLTLGHSFFCTYYGGSDGTDTAEIKLVKYY
jgi:hypothetical protein